MPRGPVPGGYNMGRNDSNQHVAPKPPRSKAYGLGLKDAYEVGLGGGLKHEAYPAYRSNDSRPNLMKA